MAARRNTPSPERVSTSIVTRWRRFLTKRRNSFLVSFVATLRLTSGVVENDLRPSVTVCRRRPIVSTPAQRPLAVGAQVSPTRAIRLRVTRILSLDRLGSRNTFGGEPCGALAQAWPVRPAPCT